MLGLDAGSRMCRAGFSILYNRLMRVSRSSSLHAAISGALAEPGVLEHDLAARMAAAAGLWNLIAHRYGALDWTRIHDVASHHVQDLLRFCDVAAGVAIDGEPTNRSRSRLEAGKGRSQRQSPRDGKGSGSRIYLGRSRT